MGIELTIGMATYNDYEGVYFTLQALRLYHDLQHTELLVIDNYGCGKTKDLVENTIKGSYILTKGIVRHGCSERCRISRGSGKGGAML